MTAKMKGNIFGASIAVTRRAGLLFLIALIHFLLFFHLVFEHAAITRLAKVSTVQFTLIQHQLKHENIKPHSAKIASSSKMLRAIPIHQTHVRNQQSLHVTHTSSEAASVTSTIASETRQETVPENPAVQPTFDLGQLRSQVLKNERMRNRTPEEIFREKQIVVSNATTKFEEGAKRAEKKDCRTAYAGVGLLAIIPLVVSTATDTGCKW